MSSTLSNPLMKPFIMAGCVVVGDKYLLMEQDLTRSLYFGVAGGVGVYAAQLVAPLVPLEKYLPNGAYTDSKTLELRLLEIGGGSLISFGVNKYVMNNDPFITVRVEKLALLAGANFVAEYITDYMENRALSFFQ